MKEGMDPYELMQQVAGKLDAMDDRDEIARALDDLEYVMEVLDPELQEPAYDLVERLRKKLEQAG